MIFDPLASSSHGNAYVVSDGHTSILLECGIPFRKLQKALGFRMGDIMACFVSHEHIRRSSRSPTTGRNRS